MSDKDWEDNALYCNYYGSINHKTKIIYYYCSIHKCRLINKDRKMWCVQCNDFVRCRTKKEMECEK